MLGKLPGDPVLGNYPEIWCWKNHPEIKCWENYPEIQDIINQLEHALIFNPEFSLLFAR